MENEKILYIQQNGILQDVIHLYMCGITYPNKNYAIRRKTSKYAVIEYVEKGCGVVHIDGKTFYPTAGDSYLLQPGTSHHYHSDKDDPWQKCFINFGGPLVEKLIESYNLEQISYFPNLNLQKELNKIIEIATNANEDCTPDIVAVINQMFTKIYLEINTDRHISEIAREMKRFLDSRVTSSFTNKELCDIVNKSESQAIKIFKKSYNETPYAYVLNKKISFAKNMFTNTSLSVKEVAYNLGFTDEYYFSNIFKTKVGCSPTQYRKSKQRS